jgi:hypothetical protein
VARAQTNVQSIRAATFPAKDAKYLRLEPGDDPRTLEEGIAARIKDPLWMVGRQRQMGELRARNSASVVRAELATRLQSLTRLRSIEGGTAASVDNRVPLEAQVEAEPQPAGSIPDHWRHEALTYAFQLESETGTRLVSDRYDGGRLDWFDFDVVEVGAWGTPSVTHLKPTAVSFPGAPHPRWWTLEDRRIDLGGIRRPQLNMLNLLAMEFSLLYENDWYMISVPQPVGHLRRVDRLTVVDSFGFAVDARAVVDRSRGRSGFEVFTLTARGGESPDGRVFLAPNIRHQGLRAEAIERVSFLRDEGANLAWAIEHRYRDDSGTVVNRSEEDRPPDSLQRMYWDRVEERLVPRSEVTGAAEPGTRFLGPVEQYEPQTYVPPSWIPYQALRVEAAGHLALRRSRTQVETASGPQYRSRVVAESTWIDEQAVSRLGTRVERAEQMVLSTDGRRVSWMGRRVLIDEHREPSGLRFDALLRPQR